MAELHLFVMELCIFSEMWCHILEPSIVSFDFVHRVWVFSCSVDFLGNDMCSLILCRQNKPGILTTCSWCYVCKMYDGLSKSVVINWQVCKTFKPFTYMYVQAHKLLYTACMLCFIYYYYLRILWEFTCKSTLTALVHQK